MRVGILGSGLMGGKLGTIFARAGHEIVFSYARSEQKLKTLAREAKGNAKPGTPRDAAQEGDALLLAVHWSRIDDVLKQAGDLSGKVIVTCSLPTDAGNTKLIVANTSSGVEELTKKIPKARVVSAFNTVPSEVLFGVYEARRKTPRPSLVYCGDDESGKTVAAELIRDAGFDPVDAGPLHIARYTEPFALLVAQLAYEGEGGPIEEIRPGDVVWFSPGEKHWHGATPTTAMTHIAIQEQLNGKAVDWMEKVSDEQYRR